MCSIRQPLRLAIAAVGLYLDCGFLLISHPHIKRPGEGQSYEKPSGTKYEVAFGDKTYTKAIK